MSTKSLLHQARLKEWVTKFTDQKASGLSVTDWCLKNNISKYKFLYWKRLLSVCSLSRLYNITSFEHK